MSYNVRPLYTKSILSDITAPAINMGRFLRKKVQKLSLVVVAALSLYFTLILVFDTDWYHSRDFNAFSNMSGLFGNTSINFEDLLKGKDVMIIAEELNGELEFSEGSEEEESRRVNEDTKILVNSNNGVKSGSVSNQATNLNISENNYYRNGTGIRNEYQLRKKELVNASKVEFQRESSEIPRENSEIPRESSDIPKGGGLRIHFWRGIALPSIKALCDHPLFPKGPSERSIITKLEVQRNENYFAQQIFGYLHPSISGLHTFAVASDDNSQVWLREEGSKQNAVKICSVENESDDLVWTSTGEFNKYPSQKSKPLYLEKRKKYYIEVLHMQSGADDFLQVLWLQPGATNYSVIDSESTSMINGSWNASMRIGNGIFGSEACKGITKHHHLRTGRILTIDRPRYIEHEELEDALPVCPYRPEYINRKGPLPEGRWDFILKYREPTYIYPWIVYPRVYRLATYGDYPLEYKEADTIVREYMNITEKKYTGVYKLNNIIQVEKKHDRDKGARYLVELNVTKDSNYSTCVISEYIYKNFSSKTLCYPENLQWQRHDKIAIIISIRNQGNWMRHFLDNLEEIYVSTGEKNVSLVVFDYESNDIDLDEEIRARQLPPHMVIRQAGKFSRCQSINAAVRAVKDPHTIVFTLDLHLEIPNNIFDEVRKHCFEGRSVFTPVILRLRPGHSPVNLYGYWEQQGYGLLAMYKSDWDRIGGLDEEKYKNKWGGEDWEIMERVVGAGMEYERVREFKMFHFHHSKKGMWTGDEAIQNEKDPFST